MIKTTFRCDRCNHSQDSPQIPRQIWSVCIFARTATVLGVILAPFAAQAEAQYCRECMIAVGIPPMERSPGVPVPAPTLEDQIREIAFDAARDVLRGGL